MINAIVTAGNDVTNLDEWQQRSNPWTVTLSYEGRDMTVPFWTGSGWTTEPDAHDVMQCLCSDAVSVDNCADFEQWACELGFDTDSRKAERVYRQCVMQRDALRTFLESEYDAFVYADDDALEMLMNFDDTVSDLRQRFADEIAPLVVEQYGEDDVPAMDEAFNNWTDALCKAGEIPELVYERVTRED